MRKSSDAHWKVSVEQLQAQCFRVHFVFFFNRIAIILLNRVLVSVLANGLLRRQHCHPYTVTDFFLNVILISF